MFIANLYICISAHVSKINKIAYCDRKRKKANIRNDSQINRPTRRTFSPIPIFTDQAAGQSKRELVDHSRLSNGDRGSPIGGSRATRRSNRVAINQLDPGHERNLLLSTPHLPPPHRTIQLSILEPTNYLAFG